MKDSRMPDAESNQRLLDLLADRAVFGLDAEEETELAKLMAIDPAGDHDAFDRLAAAMAVATHAEKPPLLTSGRSHGAGRRGILLAITALAGSIVAVVSWSLFSGWRLSRGPQEPVALIEPAADMKPTAVAFAGDREAMLEQVEDAVRMPCGGITRGGDPALPAERPEGDIVWSPSRQRGFLRIRGLDPNDPRERQYQIWIIVGRRAVPVRGGVFDVSGDDRRADVIVPILPQEFVESPAMFAVTVEKPGGSENYSESRAVALAD